MIGGGGLVGMAYHAGALKALDEWGIDLAGSDVIVGTSAGAIIGAYLGSGWAAGDFYEYAHGRHPDVARDPADHREQVRRIFTPLWGSRSERMRRSVGSFFAIAAARGYWRPLVGDRIPARLLRRSFPSGLYSTDETRQRLCDDLPQKWPRDGLYICTADLYSGRRVAFGSPGAPEASFPDAVLASTAIPGVFPPVRIGARHYVDGGVVSATSLDLAVSAGCDRVLCIAPLGYRKEAAAPTVDPKMWGPMFVRTLFARALSREVKEARAQGVDVFVVRPWVTELKAHGTNSMRHHDRVAVTESAREGTLRLLDENQEHPALVDRAIA